MDLQRFGIEYRLDKDSNPERDLHVGLLRQGTFSKTNARATFPTSGEYIIGPMLGKGTYAESYQASPVGGSESDVCVIKVIRIERRRFHADLVNILKECLINILMEEESRDQPEGPYVPRFHEVCFDAERGLVLLRIERLQGILADVYNGATTEQNDIHVPETLGDMANILLFFHKRLAFNHRDLKSDNVMYVVAPSGKLLIKLIDFGFACLTWRGVRIAGALYFPLEDPCFIPSRDLCQFVYEILMSYRRRFSQAIVGLLEEILTFPLGDKMCKMFKGCQYKRRRMRKWLDTYDFLNESVVRNPHTEPEALYGRMMTYMGRAVPKRTSPVPPMDRTGSVPIRSCAPEQILNPTTRRCVSRASATGKRLMEATERRSPAPVLPVLPATVSEDQPTPVPNKQGAKKTKRRMPRIRRKSTRSLAPCKTYQTRNPMTRRCRNRCGIDKIRNPRTGRCMSRKGRIGRALLEEGVQPTT